ncbi:MAG: AI-2E family transporter [Ignavibacteriales bacterium]|nr:AI-2E family transporter [Ignavibacteriales bacterium]
MSLSDELIRKILKWSGIVIAVAVIFYFAYVVLDIIIILIISLLIAMIFDPLVGLLEKYKFNRFSAVVIVFTIAGTIIYFALSIFIPKISNQLNSIYESISKEEISQLFAQIESEIKNLFPFLESIDLGKQLGKIFSDIIVDSINNMSNILSSIFSIIILAVLVPFITFFILKDNKQILKGLVNIAPNRYFEMTYYVIRKIRRQLGRFVRAWIFDAFSVGLLSGIGLAILGINNPITIGVVAGVGHLIPYFGPIIGGIPAVIVSVLQFGNLSMILPIILMFTIVYIIDNGLIQPNVFGKSTDMHPLVIIILIIFGGQLFGGLGMLLAVPSATVIRTAFQEIYFGYKNYKIIHV